MKTAQSLTAILIYLIISTTANAQLTYKQQNKVNKIYRTYNKGKTDKAESKLLKLCRKDPENGPLWDLLVNMQHQTYQEKQKLDNPLVSLLSGLLANSGKGKKNIKVVYNIGEEKPSEHYKKQFINTMREASLKSEIAQYADIYLRNYLIDHDIDTAISDSAWKVFKVAEDAFFNKNYDKAKTKYKEALEIEPDFYKASLYLGDAYYANEEYVIAAKYFKKAVEVNPWALEPRKYLTDAYYYMEAYDDAREACIEGIIIHPDAGMHGKLEQSAYASGKRYPRNWLKREVFPNSLSVPATPEDIEICKDHSTEWSFYLEAKEKIKAYCNEEGRIIKDNDLTTANYLEVYSWEHMLDNTDPGEFIFARKMRELGYLDCYVFTSLYHIDLEDQYSHFSRTNIDRLKKYFDLLLSM